MKWTVLVLFVLVGVAHAGPKEQKEAIKRFEKANTLYKAGQYQEALFLYQAAYELFPSPTFLFNRALAKEKTFDYEGCALDFEEYIASGGEDVDDAKTRATSCRARVKIKVAITTVPAGVMLSEMIDGEPFFRGRTPTTLEVAPGPHDIVLELDGYLALSSHLEVVLGKPQGYDFPMEKLAKLVIDAAGVAGAMVTIDDAPPEAAPVTRVVRAGNYHVHVTAPGHVDDDRTVTLDMGSELALSIALPVLPTKQRLRVRALVPAEILIDGAPPDDSDLAAGVHVVEARADGRVPFRGQVVLPAGKDVDAMVALPARRSRLEKALLWGGAGAVALFAIGGGIYGGLALDAEAAYRDMPSRETRDNGLAFRFASDLCLGTALVAGVATAVSWWLTRPHDASIEILH